MFNPLAKHYLMAVVFLDLTGYTRLMAKSESKALGFLAELESLIRAEVPLFNGQLVKFGAEGIFAAFSTGVSAVSFSLRIQERIAARNAKKAKADKLRVRIGIHLGDVMREKNQLVGDAVNIATQIKPMAEPGGIAMTDTAYYQVKNQIALRGSFQSGGGADIPEHMQVFLVPPLGNVFFLWSLKKNAGRTAAVLLAGLLAFSATGYYRARDQSERMALMSLQIEGGPEAQAMAREFQEELDQAFAGLAKIQWVGRDGALFLLSGTAGAPAPEVQALEAARKGKLGYLLTCRLWKSTDNHWKLRYRILSTEKLTVAEAATLEGLDADSLAAELSRQVVDWAGKAY